MYDDTIGKLPLSERVTDALGGFMITVNYQFGPADPMYSMEAAFSDIWMIAAHLIKNEKESYARLLLPEGAGAKSYSVAELFRKIAKEVVFGNILRAETQELTKADIVMMMKKMHSSDLMTISDYMAHHGFIKDIYSAPGSVFLFAAKLARELIRQDLSAERILTLPQVGGRSDVITIKLGVFAPS